MLLFHMHAVFFFEIPSFEELQDSKGSPRREELGRLTLRAFGGLLTTFFYQKSFGVFTNRHSTGCRRPSTTDTNKPPNASGVEESNSPRRGLHF